jgi:hypothetical protein
MIAKRVCLDYSELSESSTVGKGIRSLNRISDSEDSPVYATPKVDDRDVVTLSNWSMYVLNGLSHSHSEVVMMKRPFFFNVVG